MVIVVDQESVGSHLDVIKQQIELQNAEDGVATIVELVGESSGLVAIATCRRLLNASGDRPHVDECSVELLDHSSTDVGFNVATCAFGPASTLHEQRAYESC